ncbi:conjugal transfer protein TraN [Tepidimonas sp. HKU79]|uniref:conjugal transfer protein TraN n=1 Tax=Tepidimonas sp. HKU79 TaxID=3414505 RepID=UPI003C7E6B27
MNISCWEYEDTYTCLKPNAINYCQPLINAGCWQTNSTCAQWDSILGSGCMKYTQTYRCSDPSQPTPPMATPNCPTCGRSNCSRQDGRIMRLQG